MNLRKTMKPGPVIISPMRHSGVLVALVIVVVLSVVVLVLSALTTPLTAEAHAPGVVLSGVGTATIDGQLAPGEWDSAGKIDLLVNLPLSDGGGITPGTLFVMNDGSNLYLGVKVLRTQLNTGSLGFGLDQVAFEFDNNHNGGPQEEGDDILLLSPGLSFSGVSAFFDEVRTSRPPCPAGAGLLYGFLDTQLNVPGTNDGAGAATNNGSFSFFEMSHPLDSADNLNDFSLTPGSTVGFTLQVNLSSLTPFCSSGCSASTPFPSSGGAGDILIATSARDQITNGSFESDYAGWTLVETPLNPCNGTWGIAANGFTLNPGGSAFDFKDRLNCVQFSPGLPITFAATDGNKLAFQLQNGSQFHRMYQDVVLGPPATLHWDMKYRNHSGGFDPTNQYLAVRIRDLSDTILQTIFITNPGDALQIPITHFSADLTAYANSTVRLSVEMQVNSFFFDAQFDNFKLAPNCTAPLITSVDATPNVIWPPNHKLTPVTVTVNASAVCGPPVCKIVSITSDEPDDGSGDGGTSGDAVILGGLNALVRAERSGGFAGRTYTITVECKDTAGNAATKTTTVLVPHDQR